MRYQSGAIGGLLAILIGIASPTLADDSNTNNLSIRWLDAISQAAPTPAKSEVAAETTPAVATVPMATLVAPPKALPPIVQELPLKLGAPESSPAVQQVTSATAPAAGRASMIETAAPSAKASESAKVIKPVSAALPLKQATGKKPSAQMKNAVKPVVTKQPTPTPEPKKVVAKDSAVKQTVQTTAASKPSQPTPTGPKMTFTAGGRWQVKAAPGGDRSMLSMLADPFSNRRPPEWNALYRASLQPQKTQLIGVTQPATNFAGVAGVTIVPTSYHAQSCGSSNNCCTGCATGNCCGGDCGCSCNSCTGGGCTTGCAPNCCGPVWSAGIDAIFLSRDGPDMGAELVSCNCEENLFFAANGFDPDITAAPRFRLFRHHPCGPGFELTYFNLDSWNDTRHFAGDLNVFGNDLGENSIAAATFDSQLQSLEVNLIRNHGCWTKLISGFRWVQLDEYSRVEGANATTLVSRGVNATNNLYGGHFGFRRLLYDYCGCLTLDSTVKAGVYGNRIHRHARGYGSPSLSDTGVSFIGDVEFQANFEITCNCTFTTGYQLLWLTGLASAPEQFHALDYINKGETVFLHGANVGFVYTW